MKASAMALRFMALGLMALLLIVVPGVGYAQDEIPDCDNQWLIDTCKWGCNATEGVCGFACGAAEDTCKWGCNAGESICDELCGGTEQICKFGCTSAEGVCGSLCDVADGFCYAGCGTVLAGCVASIPFRCWPWDYGDCERACERNFNSCKNGCNANCDFCILDCADNCELPCDNCVIDCESGCDINCDNCRLPCEEDCQFPCRQIGESCIPIDPGFGQRCAAGLTCFPTLGIITKSPTGFTCFDSQSSELYPDDVCLGLYSRDLHQAAIDANITMSYGTVIGGAVGVQSTTEVGTVYGQDGSYGCYVTECWGGTTDVEFGISACAGFYNSIDDFRGQSDVFIEDAGEIVTFSTAQVTDLSDGRYLGTADCLSLEGSLLPVSVALLTCSTMVDIVGTLDSSGNLVQVSGNTTPPTALCSDATVCADALLCIADPLIDNGSFDPNGDNIYFSQIPAGPYRIGNYTVTLTVADEYGNSSSCGGQVTVNDCTPPTITCPAPTTTECTGNRQAVVDPGDALASDTCSTVTATDPGPASYPLGNTVVSYTATDASGNSATCNTTVSVVDTTGPSISCNAHDIAPRDTPISFTATGDDACDEATVQITAFDCFKFTKKGKRIDKTESCEVKLDGNTITIVDSGGVDTHITWTVLATDASGHSTTGLCTITVQKPGLARK